MFATNFLVLQLFSMTMCIHTPMQPHRPNYRVGMGCLWALLEGLVGGDAPASMAWLRALSQPVPQAWEFCEEQEVNDAAGQVDLLLNE